MARPTGRDIRGAAISAATDAIKSSGVTGFSYADLAERIGVRAPSIHHHFRHKEDLVAETTARYRDSFRSSVSQIDDARAVDRLRRYGEVFLEPAADHELCLCGAAVAGWDDLNPKARAEITGFFVDEINWVRAQVAEAIIDGDLRANLDAQLFATSFVAALEGALLLARTQEEKRSPIPDLMIDLASAH